MNTIEITQPLASTAWLSENLANPSVVVLNATIPKVTGSRSQKNELQIQGTLFFDIKKVFSDLSSDLPNMLPDPKDFQENARKLGINANSKIVIYDELGIYSSARVWWMFRIMGHTQVAILDGGMPAWLEANLPTEEKSDTKDVVYGNFESNFDKNMVVDQQTVLDALDQKEYVVLDARSNGRFYGTAPEPRADLKSGHMPNAKSLPYFRLLQDGKTMKPIEELKTIFDEFDLENKQLIFSCGSGITACILLLAAYHIGLKNLAVYDGSWTEWGQSNDLPITC